MTDTRTRTVPNRDALEVAIDDYERDGYTVDRKSETRAVAVKRTHGRLLAHAVIALLTAWWTLGLANLAYALWRRYAGADRVEIVVA